MKQIRFINITFLTMIIYGIVYLDLREVQLKLLLNIQQLLIHYHHKVEHLLMRGQVQLLKELEVQQQTTQHGKYSTVQIGRLLVVL
jgi:hypothetical protein